MERSRGDANVIPFPARAPKPAESVGDLRFRTLVGEKGWAELPAALRIRFEHHIGPGTTILYSGQVVECRMSRCGWIFAQLARLVGGPLPLSRDTLVPAAVSVTEDHCNGGQFWTRLYGRHRGFPQVIHSSKCFAGPTGLEEYVGCGLGIALRLQVQNCALHFLSDHYFLRLGRLRVRLPRWASPGQMRVSHVDCGHGWFAFMLRLVHPLLGELVCQTALFRDRPDPDLPDPALLDRFQ